jgi:hypothetical protein
LDSKRSSAGKALCAKLAPAKIIPSIINNRLYFTDRIIENLLNGFILSFMLFNVEKAG